MSPKSELMIYIGIVLEGHRNIFICSLKMLYSLLHMQNLLKIISLLYYEK